MNSERLTVSEALTVRLPKFPDSRHATILGYLDEIRRDTGVEVWVVGFLDEFKRKTLVKAVDASNLAQAAGANYVRIPPRDKPVEIIHKEN